MMEAQFDPGSRACRTSCADEFLRLSRVNVDWLLELVGDHPEVTVLPKNSSSSPVLDLDDAMRWSRPCELAHGVELMRFALGAALPEAIQCGVFVSCVMRIPPGVAKQIVRA